MFNISGYNSNKNKYINKTYSDFETAYKIIIYCNLNGWKLSIKKI